MTPATLASYAERLDGVSVSSMAGEQIRGAGMGAFAAVAQGSRQDPRLIRLEYRGAPDGGPLLGLIGKAVTFDSGGLSIKPAGSMPEMKFDMSGGAAVIEAVAALAELRAPVNVLGVVGATENMPDGDAVKPGDIVRALDGTTIEINNTDAEGRLVLADCISYARREGCERLIDICTLTGGIVVALGSWRAGLMANNDAWAQMVCSCAERAGEPVWRMPLGRDYADMVKGRYADITNLTERREASSITGAEFLHHFVGEVPWAHLDIAGTAYDVPRSYLGKSATGFGVRLLVEAASALAGLGAWPRKRIYRYVSRPPSVLETDHAQELAHQPDLAAAPGRGPGRPSSSAARPRALIGLGTPPSSGATIRLTRSGSAPSIRRSGASPGPSSTSTRSLPNTIRTGGYCSSIASSISAASAFASAGRRRAPRSTIAMIAGARPPGAWCPSTTRGAWAPCR